MAEGSGSIDIYVGCTESQMLVTKVLASSVRRRTRADVRIFPLHQYAIAHDMPADPQNRPGTPFSFHRFMIPEIAGYKGRAIYMDCDQIVFKDIRRLAERKIGPSGVSSCDTRNRSGKPRPSARFSMMLIDCERTRWRIKDIIHDLDSGEYTYNDLFSLARYDHDIPTCWNSLDFYLWPRTCLIHYTRKERQPWINNVHKRGYLWMRELFAAVDDGAVSEKEVEEAVERELVRPSLLYQLRNRKSDLRALPDDEKRRDAPFIAACAERQFNNVPGDYAPFRDK